MPTWTGKHFESYLKSHNTVHYGNMSVLKNICVLLKRLICDGMKDMMSTPKPTLKKLCTQLELPIGTRDDTIKSISDVALDVSINTASNVVVNIDQDSNE